MTVNLSQFYEVFFDETSEHLAEMENLLLGLDESSPAADDLNAIFRAAHSIKGGAGTFGFDDMTNVTHDLETLLDKLRKQEMRVSAEMVNVFLEACDVIKMQLAHHRGVGEINNSAIDAVSEKMRHFSDMDPTSGKKSAASLSGEAARQSSGSGSGFFADHSSVAPGESKAIDGKKITSAAEVSAGKSSRGATHDIHGQGYGFFDDEFAPATKPAVSSAPLAGKAARYQSEDPKILPKVGTTGKAETLPAESTDEVAEQKAKRDFHGKGFGFF